MQNEEHRLLTAAASMALIGAIIGLGKLLQSRERLTWRLAIGRAITTSALAVAAFSVLAWIPGISIYAVIGMGALLASLGESFIEKLINRSIGGKD